MSDDNHDIQAIFCEALDKGSPEELEQFLASACGDDSDLLSAVEELLSSHREAGKFLGGGATAEATDIRPVTEQPGDTIGPYKLLQQIGEGGMGVVYMAEQKESVKRRVALKIIKPGMDTRQVIARFEAERQALAMMDHPNIAKVLDAGTTETGRPYFVMELVKGIPVTKYCDQEHLTVKERLELFLPICQAIQHAHQKGIIHRDVKPTNILVARYDGKPVPKVIDFGVAKATSHRLTEKTMFTHYGQIVGTIEYMAPEQAEFNQLDIDTRCDIYSLGVLLYELLTGETPFDKQRLRSSAFDELLRIIREEEPPRPSTKLSSSESLPNTAVNRKVEPTKLSVLVRGELDWIVMKALEKDRNRRYETASSFAADIQHYLNDEAVTACPPSAAYKFRKFARRNKAALSTFAIIAVSLLLAVGSIGWMVRDHSARDAQARRERVARQQHLAGQVESILAETDQLMSEEKWPQALATAMRAETLVQGGETDKTTQQHVNRILVDLMLVQALENARLRSAEITAGDWNRVGADRAYIRAFRQAGINIDGVSVDEAVAQLRMHPVILHEIAKALGDWSLLRRDLDREKQIADWRHLLTVADAIDFDSTRQSVRDALKMRNEEAGEMKLRQLANQVDTKKLQPTTLCLLAQVMVERELYAAAETILLNAYSHHPSDFWVNFQLGLCLSEMKSNRSSDAVGYYRAALALRPDNAFVLNNLGNALRQQSNFEEAIAAYHRALEIDPAHVTAHNNLGNVLGDQGNLEEAIAEYRHALEIDPEYATAHDNLGLALKDQGKLEEAIAEHRRAVEIDPDDATCRTNLGAALHDQGNLDEAVAEYHRALEIDPAYVIAHNNLGNSLMDQGNLEEAIAEFRHALEIDPEYATAHLNLGLALKGQGNLEEAIAEFRHALEIDPLIAKAHCNLGQALADQGKLEQAIAAYQRALDIDPQLAMAHNNLGVALMDQGELQGAIAACRKAIELSPSFAMAHNNLGLALHRQGHLDEAIAEYHRAIEIDPEFSAPHNNLGLALKNQGKVEQAFAEYRRAVELDASLKEAHYNLAIALMELGNSEKAIAECRRTLEIDPKYVEAQYTIGLAFERLAKREAAIAAYRRALEIDPEYSAALNNLGLLLQNCGEYENAAELFKKALEVDPDEPFYHNNLGVVFYRQKQYERALACYRRAIELDPHYAAPYSGIGNVLKAQGQLDEAIVEYQRAIEIEPEHGGTHYNLGIAYKKQNRIDEAVSELRKAYSLDAKLPLWNFVWLIARDPDRADAEYVEALQIGESCVKNDPESEIDWQVLGWARYRNGQWQAAIDALNKSVELQGQGGDEHQWFFLAMAYWQLGRKEPAREWFDKSVFHMERRAGVNVEQQAFRNEAEKLFGLSLTNEDRRQIALDYATRQLQDNPDDAKLLLWRGNQYIALRRYEEAETDFSHLVELQPDDQRARLKLSVSAMFLGDREKVIEQCNAAIHIGPPKAEAYCRRAEAYAKMGKFKLASADFEWAIELDAEFRWTYSARGEMFAGMANWHQALDDFREYHRYDSTNRTVIRKIALLLLATGDRDGYRRWCADLHSQYKQTADPAIGQSLLECALLAPEGLKDYPTLIELADADLADHPESHTALTLVGAARLRAGQIEAALAHLKSLVGPNSQMILKKSWLALARINAAHSEQASELLDAVDEWLAESPNAYWVYRLEIELLRQEAKRLLAENGTQVSSEKPETTGQNDP